MNNVKSKTTFPIALIGREVLDGEVNFTNLVKILNSRREYNAFVKDIKAESIPGELTVGSDGLSFKIESDPGTYEAWTLGTLVR